MTQASLPDLTGQDPACLVSNDNYTIYTSAQRIEFGQPVYLNTIAITMHGTNAILVISTDWFYNNADIAYTTISKLKNVAPAFDQIVVHSIEIISPQAMPYQISCSYQTVYPSKPAISVATPRLLAEDHNALNAANVVSDNYAINSFLGNNVIRPVCGAFFADSVSIVLPTNPVTTLVKDVDYTIFGLDSARTKATSNTSGVYTAILITRAYAGTLAVTYHAYGGGFTLYDAVAMQNEIATMQGFLNATQFLTSAALGTNPVIESILTRLLALESRLLAAAIP